MRSYALKEAIDCLQSAGIVYKIHHTAASGIPLNTLLDLNKYKLFFLDVGLVTVKSGLSAKVLMDKEILLLNRGEIAEQFVCQELLANRSYFKKPELYYWSRPEKTSTAEVDFVIQQEDKIIPIEVKAGSTGQLKSLKIMMQEKKLPIGVRISQKKLSYESEKKIISIPLYMVSEIGRLVGDYFK